MSCSQKPLENLKVEINLPKIYIKGKVCSLYNLIFHISRLFLALPTQHNCGLVFICS